MSPTDHLDARQAENPYRAPRPGRFKLVHSRNPLLNILLVLLVVGVPIVVGVFLGCLAWLSLKL
jgi:hypothetical protein